MAKPPKTPEPKGGIVVLKGASNVEFGAAMVKEAEARIRKAKTDKAVTFAQTVLESIEECDRKIAWFTGWKETRKGQLEALNQGAFSFDTFGQIVYDDESLNRQ